MVDNKVKVCCHVLLLSFCSPDASVVHTSGIGQLQTTSHVAVLRLSSGKPIQRAVTTMGSNDLLVGEDHMVGLSCQWYNWQMGR